MGENDERRRAHRQKRGLLRVDDILQVAGTLFAEVGYDKTTTNAIAVRAGMSVGSLYQFFPNKEAIAQAYAAYATDQLHKVYDSLLAPAVIALPLRAFLDVFIDAVIDFNQTYPGYLALSLGSTISPPLASALAELQQSVFARLDAVFAARWQYTSAEQRRLPLLIMYRLFLAVLPLILQSAGDERQAIVRELKTVAYRYGEPFTEAPQFAPQGEAT